ncbi:MAG: energy-coupling factor transporter ATPase [Clostridia bacterium]
MEERIAAEEVAYAYEGAEIPAVRGVSMRIDAGEFVAVLGHNGSGKSTLAKLMNALYLPTGGMITVCGMDTRDEAKVWEIRQHAGMVFQNPDNQLVATIVEEDVAFGLENLGVPSPAIRIRVEEALDLVGMRAFQTAAPHMLSGGQKQRVAIAGVLAMKPAVIILDEATAMLDPAGRREVMETVQRLRREEDIAVVWITHFMEEAVQADRIAVMHEGKVVLMGTPREVFAQRDRLRGLQLEVPPMTELAAELRQAGVDICGDLLTVEEMVEEICRLSSKD